MGFGIRDSFDNRGVALHVAALGIGDAFGFEIVERPRFVWLLAYD